MFSRSLMSLKFITSIKKAFFIVQSKKLLRHRINTWNNKIMQQGTGNFNDLYIYSSALMRSRHISFCHSWEINYVSNFINNHFYLFLMVKNISLKITTKLLYCHYITITSAFETWQVWGSILRVNKSSSYYFTIRI